MDGHICTYRMDASRQSKGSCLGSYIVKSRQFDGTKQRWRDVVNNNLKTLHVPPIRTGMQ